MEVKKTLCKLGFWVVLVLGLGAIEQVAIAQIIPGPAAPTVAQIPPPPVVVVPPAVPAVPETLPQNWVGAFSVYDPSASPKVSGGFSTATLLSPGAQLYNFNSYDVTYTKAGFVSSPRAGVAMLVKHFGNLYVFGFGNAGVATTGSNASFAVGTGGLAIVKFPNSNWTIFGAARPFYTGALGGMKLVYEIGFGRTF